MAPLVLPSPEFLVSEFRVSLLRSHADDPFRPSFHPHSPRFARQTPLFISLRVSILLTSPNLSLSGCSYYIQLFHPFIYLPRGARKLTPDSIVKRRVVLSHADD